MKKINEQETVLYSYLKKWGDEDEMERLQELYAAEEQAYENVKYIGVGILIGIGLCVIFGLSIIVTSIWGLTPSLFFRNKNIGYNEGL